MPRSKSGAPSKSRAQKWQKQKRLSDAAASKYSRERQGAFFAKANAKERNKAVERLVNAAGLDPNNLGRKIGQGR